MSRGRLDTSMKFCFELLHNLLTRHALFDSLEEYFFGQIINVDSGCFIYNDLTLTLLAHFLTCRVGSTGSQLRNNIYRGDIDFIVEKTKALHSKCPSLKEHFLGLFPLCFTVRFSLWHSIYLQKLRT